MAAERFRGIQGLRPATGCGAGGLARCGSGNMSIATFDPDPTDKNIRLPSGEKTMSRA
jgi:hypothetical protein